MPAETRSKCTCASKKPSGFNLTREMLLKMAVYKRVESLDLSLQNPRWPVCFSEVLGRIFVCFWSETSCWYMLSFMHFCAPCPILKYWAKSSLYGFLSVMFSHGFIVLSDSCICHDTIFSIHVILYAVLYWFMLQILIGFVPWEVSHVFFFKGLILWSYHILS